MPIRAVSELGHELPGTAVKHGDLRGYSDPYRCSRMPRHVLRIQRVPCGRRRSSGGIVSDLAMYLRRTYGNPRSRRAGQRRRAAGAVAGSARYETNRRTADSGPRTRGSS